MLSRATETRRPTGRRVAVAAVLLAVVALLVAYVVTTRPSSSTTTTTTTTTSKKAQPSRQVLLDATFDGGRLDAATWNTCHWWADRGCTIATNDELEWYLPGQVSVADGALRLTADRAPVMGSDGKSYEFRSGMVTTGPPPMTEDAPAKLAFTYGSVEARVRIPAGRGLWPAVWLLPASRESVPEIDLLEAIGQDPGTVLMHLHPKDRSARSPNKEFKVRGPNLAEDWHILRLDWSKNLLEFFVDNVRVWRVTGGQVPDEPMYVVLNLAVGGAYPGPPSPDTQFPATFLIDYLRITAD
jgi:beta-glucanase (GH16 family)